ncbi:MAG: pyruvate ferredoxin oxidoreductase subunit gamma [Syntrophobacterales bacterium]|nr:pyruvate ferredoxin oxidoreductase subunit gamma [Syntrophobacterales bacterium]
MIEVRLHGRGGQGAVTSAELMALAAISTGKYAQAFPSFGPERRGAPVMAFLRVSDTPIKTREKIYNPNLVVVLDPSLLAIMNIEAGIAEDGTVVVNTQMLPEEVKEKFNLRSKVATVDATTIAREILKVPITNTTMLGSLVRVSGAVPLESLEEPIIARFGPALGEKNFSACKRAYGETRLMQ